MTDSALVALSLAVGCTSSTATGLAGTGNRVEVNAPGVNVNVQGKDHPNGGSKVKVTAPDVNVDVKKQ